MSNSHATVANNWVLERKPNMRGFNMFFRDNIIFSYGEHFPAGRIEKSRASKALGTVILIADASTAPSVSTQKHLGHIRSAIQSYRSLARVFYVRDVLARTPEEHSRNAQYMKQQAQEMRDKAKRARKHGNLYREQAQEKSGEMYRYCYTFNITAPDLD